MKQKPRSSCGVCSGRTGVTSCAPGSVPIDGQSRSHRDRIVSFLLADNALREAHALEVVTEMPRVGHLN
jgi:hypothetical protein